MPPQFIYTMYGLKKIVPGTQREILKGITLAFYPTAKIGVLGPNGRGKSTLLRIMARRGEGELGAAPRSAGHRRRRLPQRARAAGRMATRGNARPGVARTRA